MNSPTSSLRRGKGANGFTLLELLVAMTVLSLVSLLLLGGLRFGTRAWERGQTASEGVESVQAAQNLLRNLLSGLYPEWQVDGVGQGHVLIDGTPQRLVFIAPPPRQLGAGPNQRYELGRASNGDLTLSWRPASSHAFEQPMNSVLLRGAADVTIDYFGRDPNGMTLNWSSDWSNRTNVPKLIRIRVTFAAKDHTLWPELVVHPEIMVDVSCIYDAISRGCRGRPG
jgi:general secretion pathway protein J